ncbi:hypothetical protein GCM10009789_39260 [Kribbella sancticallisti]|uniref:EamA-like transporter family protein n=1 Tax=Kribbella sancticallisti TaxID=460087 RepID=A0ABP4PHU5_9ACTN
MPSLFWIIRQAGLVAASTVILFVPFAGSFIGVLWLDEPAPPGLILGATVILTAVGLLKGSARTQHQSADGPQRGK